MWKQKQKQKGSIKTNQPEDQILQKIVTLSQRGAYFNNTTNFILISKYGKKMIKSHKNCKVEFNQPSYWLYSVPNLFVFQHLVTLYLGGFIVRVVSEIEC